jgi:hypothetical protein
LNPQAPLGRFLEFSVATPEILDAWQFYQRLGFVPGSGADIWPHRYAALSDSRLALGLHGLPAAAPTLSYVLPDLARRLRAFEAVGIEFERRIVADDSFNEAEFCDPDGHRVRLLEARTFSPPQSAVTSALGWFEEVALPVAELGRARAFWEALGFVTVGEGQTPWPFLSLTSDTLDLGLYQTRELEAPTLMFSGDDPGAVRTRLVAADVEPESRLPPSLDPATHLLVVAPDATRLLLVPAPP